MEETASEYVERKLAEQYKAEHIFCPYCNSEQSQETLYEHVTYWGETNSDSEKNCYCDECGKKFIVNEMVERTFTTEKIEGEDTDGNGNQV